MQATARKVSPSTIVDSEPTLDITQNHLTHSIPTSPHEQAKVSAFGSKTATQKPAILKAKKENNLARLLAAYGDCV
ncbi:MAG TPA: hypothetical protein VES38_08975 [Methylotenera sp.]|nr:hypothetical protein [Methylotenera sp.]